VSDVTDQPVAAPANPRNSQEMSTIISTPFGFATTAAEVVDGLDLSGRNVVVTGAASGIGVETARALARAGADVTLVVRDTRAGSRVAQDIATSTGNEKVRVAHVDLSDRATGRMFAADWGDRPLHALVNNAGVMATPLTRTPEGFELQFATNHLGHFALASALHDALARADGARIVSLSSVGHRRSPVVFDDIQFERRDYDPWLGYGQAKTANVLFAVGVTQRWAGDGILANAVHPGGIMTNLQRHMGADDIKRRGWVTEDGSTPKGFKTPEQGAATSVLLAASPLLEGAGGRYFEDCNEAAVDAAVPPTFGVASYALDPESADRLWDVSVRLLGE
jgi:NAD(P)-dependent dehydrogenase (short-subunit alcohol dehydrogenase family)